MIDVLIIGGGPAGVAAALRLKRRGVARVLILEREAELGGVPRHCGHPPFGMREFGRMLTGPAYARRLRAAAEKAGVEILLQHSVVRLQAGGVLEIATPEGRKELRALRVLLATGARETPRAARLLGGDRPQGVLNTGALQAHIFLHGSVPFRRPVVVGTELVSLSSLATCRGHGIRPAAMLEAGSRAVARWPLTLFPSLLRIPLHYGAEIAEICGGAQVESVKLRDGREIFCDGVLLTGRFTPESSLARMGHLAIDAGSGGPVVDQYGRCSDAAYFAAGNLLRGIETAGWSFREGAAIADYIADDLAGGLPYAEGGVEVVCGAGAETGAAAEPGAGDAAARGDAVARGGTGAWAVAGAGRGGGDLQTPYCGTAGTADIAGFGKFADPAGVFTGHRGDSGVRIAAIDQGTTSTRVLLLDDAGARIVHAMRHEQFYPQPGWVEHDPEELLRNIRAGLAAAGPVEAIGLANQGESCLAWDALTGQALSPVIVWQDNRSAPWLEGLREHAAEVMARAGLPLDAYFSASKFSWILREMPQARAALAAGRLRLGTTDAFFSGPSGRRVCHGCDHGFAHLADASGNAAMGC